MNRRSMSGYCTFEEGNLATWHSKKQSVVARSRAEVKVRAMAHGVYETLWLKILLKELGFDSKDPMRLYCDNKVAIVLLTTWSSMIEPSMLKLIDILSKKNSETVSSAHHM